MSVKLSTINPKLQYLAYENKWRVLERIHVAWRRYDFWVEEDFLTDLGSVPEMFQEIIPVIGPWIIGTIIHDAVYDAPDHMGMTRIEADQLLIAIMNKVNCSEFEQSAVHKAVEIGGASHWV